MAVASANEIVIDGEKNEGCKVDNGEGAYAGDSSNNKKGNEMRRFLKDDGIVGVKVLLDGEDGESLREGAGDDSCVL